MLEALHKRFPEAELHLVVRAGNESLFADHPFLSKVWVWQKKQGKYRSLLRLGRQLRRERFDLTVNLQRFASSGILTVMTKAKVTVGFDKNPLSSRFTRRYPHPIGANEHGQYLHEIERNHQLIAEWCGDTVELPRLYPENRPIRPFWAEHIRAFLREKKCILIAPASVWFTKQFPEDQWVKLMDALPDYRIGILGAPGDTALAQRLMEESVHTDVHNFCGQLDLLESAQLMKHATMTYVNDSAPLHLATAVQAPVTAIYCSTVPAFGFGPKGPDARVVETAESLDCRPCGLHGHSKCPKGHFRCATTIQTEQLTADLPKTEA